MVTDLQTPQAPALPLVNTPTAPVMTPEALSAPAPMQVKPQAPSTGADSALGYLTSMADANNKTLQQKATAYETQLPDLLKSIKETMQAPGQTVLTDKAYASGGVDTAQSDLQDINNQILAEQHALERQVEQIQTGAGTATQAQRDAAAGEAKRVSLAKQADLSIIQMARQSKYDSAKAIADRAVSALTEDKKNKLDALQFAYEQNKDLFNTADKRAFESAQKTRQDELDMERQKYMAQFDQTLKQNDPLYQAQLAKARADAAAASGSADASQTLAYAQQYASDGKIPTGLPKGTFAAVAMAAKELPKPEGTIVNNNTGVAPNNLSATQMDGIVALRDLQNKINDAASLYNDYHHGVLAGVKNAFFPSDAEQQYQNLRGEIVDLLARARSGAALTADEQADYMKKLPGDFNKTFWVGANGNTKINSLQTSLTQKLDTTLATHGVSIYGYSKVDIDGQKYTVGQIITNDQGQQGRINADGSITYIQ